MAQINCQLWPYHVTDGLTPGQRTLGLQNSIFDGSTGELDGLLRREMSWLNVISAAAIISTGIIRPRGFSIAGGSIVFQSRWRAASFSDRPGSIVISRFTTVESRDSDRVLREGYGGKHD